MSESFPLALPEGSVLAGQYIIEKVLGQGGFGITYRAVDHQTGTYVAVKEYFPDSMATRTATTVIPFSGERGESYDYGKTCFLQEAETLAQFIGNENIVKIHSYFEENGTAYFVMDYVEGVSFDEYIKQNGGRVSYETAESILIPVIDALAAVHSKGIVHRDVTPDNIYITNDGQVRLLDFGAARYSIGDKSRSLDVVLKHGFAPKEQYTRHGKQGPFTDVYTVGASFYYAITGRRPPDSIDRIETDELIPPSALGVEISQYKEDAILRAMSVQPQDRFQTMTEFKNALYNASSAGTGYSSAQAGQGYGYGQTAGYGGAGGYGTSGQTGAYGASGYGTSGYGSGYGAQGSRSQSPAPARQANPLRQSAPSGAVGKKKLSMGMKVAITALVVAVGFFAFALIKHFSDSDSDSGSGPTTAPVAQSTESSTTSASSLKALDIDAAQRLEAVVWTAFSDENIWNEVAGDLSDLPDGQNRVLARVIPGSEKGDNTVSKADKYPYLKQKLQSSLNGMNLTINYKDNGACCYLITINKNMDTISIYTASTTTGDLETGSNAWKLSPDVDPSYK